MNERTRSPVDIRDKLTSSARLISSTLEKSRDVPLGVEAGVNLSGAVYLAFFRLRYSAVSAYSLPVVALRRQMTRTHKKRPKEPPRNMKVRTTLSYVQPATNSTTMLMHPMPHTRKNMGRIMTQRFLRSHARVAAVDTALMYCVKSAANIIVPRPQHTPVPSMNPMKLRAASGPQVDVLMGFT